MFCCEQEAALRTHREADDDRAVGVSCVEDGKAVGREMPFAVCLFPGGTTGAPVAARIKRDNLIVPSEKRDLHLPAARVQQRPRRQQHDRR
jgi:hypothetical protein